LNHFISGGERKTRKSTPIWPNQAPARGDD
ncbi:MAG: hypothetical protein ACI915_005130, partial [Gammaproteobacteria bacterium]